MITFSKCQNSLSHPTSKMFWCFWLVFRCCNKSQGNDFTKPLKVADDQVFYAAAEQSGYSLLPPPELGGATSCPDLWIRSSYPLWSRLCKVQLQHQKKGWCFTLRLYHTSSSSFSSGRCDCRSCRLKREWNDISSTVGDWQETWWWGGDH